MLLAGDIGGTKTDLAVFSAEKGPRSPLAQARFHSADYAGLEVMVREFLARVKLSVSLACFAVAGPVVGGRARLTNLPWVVEETALREALNLQAVRLLNDLEAIANAVPHLLPSELHTLSAGVPAPGGALAVVAPGTGLGEAFLTWDGATWDNRHVASVQITMAESFGVAGRGKFYEEAGAIRDVVQNHMLQVIACLAMECPAGTGHEALRDERGRLLRAVRALGPSDVVCGQFRGYRQEPGVSSESQVETFAAVRFFIDNARWEGVPFFVRAGKCLPVTATEVLVRFRHTPRPVLDETMPPRADYYRFRLSPAVVLALGIGVKQPGELLTGEGIELIACHQAADEMKPYERLLGDAVDGDATLFAREDSVEAAWRVVDPVLGNVTALYQYEAGSWGPPEVDRLVAPEGGWHNPKPEEVCR